MKQFLIPVILAALLCGGAVLLSRSQQPLPELAKLADAQFEDADGGEFVTANVSGKVSVWTFFFTSCEGPCPVIQTAVAKLQRQMTDLDEVVFVSLSIDPERDSAEKLREYRARLGGNVENWHMLRPAAASEPLDTFARDSFRVGLDLKELIHSNKLLLVDQRGVLRGTYDSTSEESLDRLETDIRRLAR